MKIVVNPTYKAYESFFKDLPSRFEREGILLHRGRNQVKQFELPDGTPCVVKRYKVPHLLQRIVYRWFRPSKAQRAYTFALRLVDMEIDTPTPMCYIEKSSGLLFADSYFVSTRCDYPPLYPVLFEAEQFDPELASSLAGFLVEMHQKGFLHGDLNLTNILYHEGIDGEVKFTVIDTNRSHFIEEPTKEQCLHNLVRLTHRHELMCYVVKDYARLRGWDVETSWEKVHVDLIAFEKKEERKRKLKRKLRK